MDINPMILILIVIFAASYVFLYKNKTPVVKHEEENFGWGCGKQGWGWGRHGWGCGRQGWGRPRYWDSSVYMSPYWV